MSYNDLFPILKDGYALHKIDLHGSNSDYMDWFCNKQGTFEKAKIAIKKLSENGIIIRSAMTVTPINAEQIIPTVRLAKDLGAKSMILSTVVPLGRGKNSKLIFTEKQLDSLLAQLQIAEREFKGFLFEKCENLSFCQDCLARGLKQYYKMKKHCLWGET